MRIPLLPAITVVLLLCSTALATDDFRCLDGAPTPPPRKEGQPWRICVNPANELFHGSVWRWHKNGRIASKEFYVNGDAEGEFRTWYDNGKLSARGAFKNGAKVGLWKYWDEAGRIATEVTYAPAGNVYVHYYSSGARMAEGPVVQAQKVGKWVYWDAKGKEKAHCDFGNGLFRLPDDACRMIAEELPPKGFSRPVPAASLTPAGAARIDVGGESYEFATPQGWVMDLAAAKKDHLPLAMYPKGESWRGQAPNIYVRTLYKEGRDLGGVAEDELKSFRGDVLDFRELRTRMVKLRSPRPVVSRNISYRPPMNVEPASFVVGSATTYYETLAYVDASDDTVLMAVLACRSAKQLKQFRPALQELLESLRIPNQRR
jgi:hypothetical protein